MHKISIDKKYYPKACYAFEINRNIIFRTLKMKKGNN